MDGEKYDRHLVPTDTGRAYVPAIFARVIAGESLNTIARWLESEGVAPTSGREWWARSIGTMIRCATYTGRRQDANGQTIAECPALIDAATFRAAGAVLDARPGRGVTVAAPAMLAGVLKCPRCGDSPMYRLTPPGRAAYYRCTGRGAARKGCGIVVELTATDDAVSAFLANFTSPCDGRAAHPRPQPRRRDRRGQDGPAGARPGRGRLRRSARGTARQAGRAESLPAVPDRTVLEPTGVTYGQAWSKLADAERPAWLRQNGITVRAARTGTGICEAALPGWQLAQFGAAALLTEDGVSVLIGWRSSSIDWADEDPADAE